MKQQITESKLAELITEELERTLNEIGNATSSPDGSVFGARFNQGVSAVQGWGEKLGNKFSGDAELSKKIKPIQDKIKKEQDFIKTLQTILQSVKQLVPSTPNLKTAPTYVANAIQVLTNTVAAQNKYIQQLTASSNAAVANKNSAIDQRTASWGAEAQGRQRYQAAVAAEKKRQEAERLRQQQQAGLAAYNQK